MTIVLELADEIEAVEGEAGRSLDLNLAGALCYVIGPAVFLFVRRRYLARSADAVVPTGQDQLVRFHAFQALLVAVSLLVVNLTLHVLEAAVYRASWYAGVRVTEILWWVYAAQVLLWLVMLFFGYELARIRVPGVGKMADRLAASRP